MFCPKCNSNNPEGSLFCPNCGYRFFEQEPRSFQDFPQQEQVPVYYNYPPMQQMPFQPAVKEKKKINVPAIILAVLLAAAIGVIIWSFNENSRLEAENAGHLDTIRDHETNIGFLERSVDAKDKEIGDLKNQVRADSAEKAALSKKVEYSAELMNVLSSEEKWGYATENFHADRGVMVVDRFGGIQELKFFSNYYTTFTLEVSDTNVCLAKWSDEEWVNKDTTVYVTPVSAGYATITFTNKLYDTSFKVLVIVE